MNDVNYLILVDTDGTTISDIGRGLLGEAIYKPLVAPDISSLTYNNSRDTTTSSALKQPTTVSVLPPTSVDLSSSAQSSTATLLPPAMPPTSISAYSMATTSLPTNPMYAPAQLPSTTPPISYATAATTPKPCMYTQAFPSTSQPNIQTTFTDFLKVPTDMVSGVIGAGVKELT